MGAAIWDILESAIPLIGKKCAVMGGSKNIVLKQITITDDDVYYVGTDEALYSAVGGIEESE